MVADRSNEYDPDICEERRRSMTLYFENALAHERELVKESQRVIADTLVKQATEYERRLTDLDHNLRLLLDETRNQHVIFTNDYREFRDMVNETLTTIKTWGAAGVLILGVLQFLLKEFWK
jgi:hypothetical protein